MHVLYVLCTVQLYTIQNLFIWFDVLFCCCTYKRVLIFGCLLYRKCIGQKNPTFLFIKYLTFETPPKNNTICFGMETLHTFLTKSAGSDLIVVILFRSSNTKSFKANQKIVWSGAPRQGPGAADNNTKIISFAYYNAGVSLKSFVIKNVIRNYSKRFFDCFSPFLKNFLCFLKI